MGSVKTIVNFFEYLALENPDNTTYYDICNPQIRERMSKTRQSSNSNWNSWLKGYTQPRQSSIKHTETTPTLTSTKFPSKTSFIKKQVSFFEDQTSSKNDGLNNKAHNSKASENASKTLPTNTTDEYESNKEETSNLGDSKAEEKPKEVSQLDEPKVERRRKPKAIEIYRETVKCEIYDVSNLRSSIESTRESEMFEKIMDGNFDDLQEVDNPQLTVQDEPKVESNDGSCDEPVIRTIDEPPWPIPIEENDTSCEIKEIEPQRLISIRENIFIQRDGLSKIKQRPKSAPGKSVRNELREFKTQLSVDLAPKTNNGFSHDVTVYQRQLLEDKTGYFEMNNDEIDATINKKSEETIEECETNSEEPANNQINSTNQDLESSVQQYLFRQKKQLEEYRKANNDEPSNELGNNIPQDEKPRCSVGEHQITMDSGIFTDDQYTNKVNNIFKKMMNDDLNSELDDLTITKDHLTGSEHDDSLSENQLAISEEVFQDSDNDNSLSEDQLAINEEVFQDSDNDNSYFEAINLPGKEIRLTQFVIKNIYQTGDVIERIEVQSADDLADFNDDHLVNTIRGALISNNSEDSDSKPIYVNLRGIKEQEHSVDIVNNAADSNNSKDGYSDPIYINLRGLKAESGGDSTQKQDHSFDALKYGYSNPSYITLRDFKEESDNSTQKQEHLVDTVKDNHSNIVYINLRKKHGSDDNSKLENGSIYEEKHGPENLQNKNIRVPERLHLGIFNRDSDEENDSYSIPVSYSSDLQSDGESQRMSTYSSDLSNEETDEPSKAPTEQIGTPRTLNYSPILVERVKELIYTEKTYIDGLRKVAKDYIPYFKTHCPLEQITEYNSMFKFITRIYKYQRLFYKELVKVQGDIDKIVNLFHLNYDLFNLYPKYFKLQRNTEKFLAEVKDLAKQKQEELKDKLNLQSFLLTPVQRLAKYHCLFSDINKEIIKIRKKELSELELNQNQFLTKEEEAKKYGHEGVISTIDIIRNFMSIGNTEVAKASIVKIPVNISKDFGMCLLKDEFEVTNKKKSKSILTVFLFESIVIFTREVSKLPETYEYVKSILITDLQICSDISSNHLKIGNYVDIKTDKEKVLDMETKESAVLNKWYKQLEKLLWDQLKKIKELKSKQPKSEVFSQNPDVNNLTCVLKPNEVGCSTFYVDVK